MPKPLTKSRFKLGLECPNKLYFTGKKEYANKMLEDSFLQALAQGGFQVEALARLSFPHGKFISADHWDYEGAVAQTQTEFSLENTCLFEAAFRSGNLFVRADIVEKHGSHVDLIEVKAKSFDPSDLHALVGARGGMVSSWRPYLFDLAFQKYVAQKANPDLRFTAYLMLADKTKKASVNGLNQRFRLTRSSDPRKEIDIRIGSVEEIGDTVLCKINVNDIIDRILAGDYAVFPGKSFEETVSLLEDCWIKESYAHAPASYSSCKNCEFIASAEEEAKGLQSGFKYCFSKQFNWSDADFKKPLLFEIWNFRGNGLFQSGKIHMEQLCEDDFNIKPVPGKISSSERQWLQVQKTVANDPDPYVLREELNQELATWKFPLHFIDFETSAVAIPFTAGRRPYEQVAFQFSHHLYHENGLIEHHSQFINDTPGEFPNFHFARSLREVLGNDEGSVFRFADHENSILNAIIIQLQESNEADKEELIAFLKTISHATGKSANQWCGERDMMDLRKTVLHYYYNPLMKGSNSLKYILPAIINTSPYLQQKYSKPIQHINLTSHNFSPDHIWLHQQNGQILNLYNMLPKLFSEWSEEDIAKTLSDIETVADGGAALTAYSKLQFTDMSELERTELRSSLLKYCELDTLAMVMLYEHLRFD